MKGIKKLNVYHKLTALLLAGTMAMSLSACNGNVDMKSLTPSEVLEITDVRDLTMVDELIAANKLTYYEDLDVVEAADQLERYLDIMDLLEDMDFSEVSQLEPLSEERYQEVFSLPLEEIARLKEQVSYKGKDIVELEKKLTALKQLDYLYRICQSWVHQYGQSVSIAYMMACVKGAVADELNIPVEDYHTITIGERVYGGSSGPEDAVIQVGDTYYRVPTTAGELWNTINYIYEVQGADLEGETELETYRKSLNYGKTTMAAGANVARNNRIVEQNSESYIRKNYVK